MKPAEIIIIINIIISGNNTHIKRDKQLTTDRIDALTNRKSKHGLQTHTKFKN